MWISKQIVKESSEPYAQTGKSTLNNNGSVEAVSSGVNRDLKLVSPYGYSFSLPAGTGLLLMKADGSQLGIGVPANDNSLKTGEIKITSKSGAFIHLRDDGSISLNGLIINNNGVIDSD